MTSQNNKNHAKQREQDIRAQLVNQDENIHSNTNSAGDTSEAYNSDSNAISSADKSTGKAATTNGFNGDTTNYLESSEQTSKQTDLMHEASLESAAQFSKHTSSLRVGSIVSGIYRITDEIGKGGMGTVFRAEHLILKRPVSIKVLHNYLSNEDSNMLRFQVEAEATGKLDHPNVVRVHDFGFDNQSGQPFLVMDFIDGVSFADVIAKQGPLNPKRALNIFKQICDGLNAAHENGIVHRDIKPSNVFLFNQGSAEEKVKILDFGIAKLLSEDAQKLTQTGEIFGSPLYMSPEQCSGSVVTPASDQYSCGCLFYEALTGHPPLKGATAIETIQKQLNDLPPSIRTANPHLENAHRFDAIVLKCMAKDPKDRYSSTLELKGALEALEFGQNRDSLVSWLKGRSNLIAIRGKARSKKHSLYVKAMLIFMFLLIPLALMFNFSNDRTVANDWKTRLQEGQVFFDNGELKHAEQAFERSLSQARKENSLSGVQAALEELIDLSRINQQQMDTLKIASWNSQLESIQASWLAERKEKEQEISALIQSAKSQSNREKSKAILEQALDDIMALGDAMESSALFEQVEKISTARGLRLISARTHAHIARSQIMQGLSVEAESNARLALAEFGTPERSRENEIRRARILETLGICQAENKKTEALASFQSARRIYQTELGKGPELASVLVEMAEFHTARGEQKDAQEALSNAKFILQSQPETRDTNLQKVSALMVEANLTKTPLDKRTGTPLQFPQAIKLLETMQPTPYNRLANALLNQARQSKASQRKPLLMRSFAIYYRLSFNDDALVEDNTVHARNAAQTLAELARSFDSMSDKEIYQFAKSIGARVIDLSTEKLRLKRSINFDYALQTIELASMAVRVRNNPELALELREEIAKFSEDFAPAKYTARAANLESMGQLHQDLKQWKEAQNCYEKALALLKNEKDDRAQELHSKLVSELKRSKDRTRIQEKAPQAKERLQVMIDCPSNWE